MAIGLTWPLGLGVKPLYTLLFLVRGVVIGVCIAMLILLRRVCIDTSAVFVVLGYTASGLAMLSALYATLDTT